MKFSMESFDNYALLVGGLMAAIAVTFNGTLALILAAGALLIKAIFSSIDPTINVFSFANLDNIVLALAAVSSGLLTLSGNAFWGLGIMIFGGICKAIGSAIQRGVSLEINLDNIAMALIIFIAGIFAYFGYTQISIVLTALGSMIKGILSTHFRTLPVITPSTPVPVAQPPIAAPLTSS